MEKPWEKYKASAEEASQASAPWEKYKSAEAPAEKPGILDRLKGLFSKDAEKEYEAIRAARVAENERQRAAGTSLGQTELEQTGDALTFGYLPQIQAKASELLTGDDYVTARDANIRRLQAQREAHPIPATLGTVAGTGAQMYALPLPTLGKGAGVIGGALKGAQFGALQGAIQNPGDVEGEVNPLQVDERIENAKSGAKMGALIGGAAGAGQRIAEGVSKLGKGAKGAAEATALKSSGAMLKDFRQAAGKDEVNKLGRFMIDEGMVKAGDTYETVAQKAAKVRAEAGKDLEKIYNKAVKTAESVEKMPGLNLVADKEEILKAVAKDLGSAEGKSAMVERVSKYIDDLAAEHGSDVLSPRIANDIKGAIDAEINYARNPLSKEPKSETAFSAFRRLVEGKIFNQTEYLGQAAGEKGLGKALRKTNQRYGMSTRIEGIAKDRLSRESANSAFGLHDRIAGAAGAAIGAGAAAAGGEHDPVEYALKAGGAGLLGMAGNRLASKYGNAALTRGLDKSAGILTGAGQAGQALLARPASLGRLSVGLSKNKKKKGLVEQEPGVLIPIGGESP